MLRGVDSSAQNWNCLLTRVRDDATKQTVALNSSGDEIAWFKTLTTPPSSCVFNISLSGCLIFDHRHTIYLVLPPCFDTTQENVRSLPTLPRIPHLLKALVTPHHAFQYKTCCWLWSRLVCNCSLYRFTTLHAMWSGPGNSVGIATGCWLDGPGIESWWRTRISAPVQTGPGAHPASCTMGTRSFPRVKSGQGATLTPHPLLVPWSRKSRAIPLLPLWAVRPVQSLSACTRVPFTLLYAMWTLC